MTDAVLILTTVPGDDLAETLARTLVEEHLAACVHLHGPIVSVYQWKGTAQRDVERQVVIKTMRWRVRAVESRLRELHTYELPEFLVLPRERVDGFGGDIGAHNDAADCRPAQLEGEPVGSAGARPRAPQHHHPRVALGASRRSQRAHHPTRRGGVDARQRTRWPGATRRAWDQSHGATAKTR